VAGTPPEILHRLHAETQKLIDDPKFVETFFTRQRFELQLRAGGSMEQFAALLAADREANARLTKMIGVHLDWSVDCLVASLVSMRDESCAWCMSRSKARSK
jgi:hypothetical protein